MKTNKHGFLLIIFALLFFSINIMAQENTIGGVYEVGIGATDAEPLIKYF